MTNIQARNANACHIHASCGLVESIYACTSSRYVLKVVISSSDNQYSSRNVLSTNQKFLY